MLENSNCLCYTRIMKERIFNVIINNNLIQNGDRVGVACSGGADSVVLLDILTKLQQKISFKLIAIHINHNIRGAEAERDCEFVKTFAGKLGVEFVLKQVYAVEYAKKNKLTIEESARELRYQALYGVAEELNLNKIAVAHNEDDQAETVLMHLCRGAGPNGVNGMAYQSEKLIRPLLNESKKNILEYARGEGLDFVFDSTNSDINYSRNYVRQIVFPAIEKIYPSVKQNLCKFARKMQEANEFIDGQLPKGIEVLGGSAIIKNEVLNCDAFVVKRLIKKALEKLDAIVDMEEKHINKIQELRDMQVGRKIILPHRVTAQRTYNGIMISKENKTSFSPRLFCVPDNFDTETGNVELKFSNTKTGEAGKLKLDFSKIPENSIWRKIEAGDKFKKFAGGTKSVNSFLTDKKIDCSSREKMVVLAHQNEVLVIPNVEISDRVKLDESTTKIVEISLSQGNTKK